MAALVFVAWGALYWHAAGHSNGLKCLYDDPVCSLTLGTWLLVFFTSLAFMAAFAAARFAADTYKMESRSALGQVPCTEHGHNPLQVLYVLETMEVLVGYKPPEFDPKDYHDPPEEHEFQNLGRSAIVQGSVSVQFQTATSNSKIELVPLGNIPRDRGVHVRVYISNKLENVKTQWQKPVRHIGKYQLEFYPFAPEVAEEVLPVQITGGAIVFVDSAGREMRFEFKPGSEPDRKEPEK